MINNKGITLITVVISIIILIILAGITISTLFGKNGIASMALKAKTEYQKAAEKEQQQLAGIFETNYAKYNGNLRVEGKQLVNQYGETIQLKGYSTANGDKANFDFNYYYNDTSIANIKKSGANLLRLVVLPRHYISSEEVLNKIYTVIDSCIKQDMYIIIDWHVIKEGDPNIYKDYASDFFKSIAEKYKDTPNVLYEICNEPNQDNAGYEVTWQMIADYANEIIPVIRSYSKDAVIIVGTPQSSTMIESVIDNELTYDNLMYALHMYPSASYSVIDKLQLAMENNLPIFVTEWSCYEASLNGTIDETIGNEFVEVMDYYKVSWAYFELGDDENITVAAVVKEGMWNNTLQDNILTDAGKYIKDVFVDIIMENGNAMMKYEEGYAFWNEEYRNNIITISFKSEIDVEKINQAVKNWDVSYINGTNKVIAYLLKDEENDNRYHLEIATNGPVIAPKDAQSLFSNFENLKEIDLTNFNTTYVYNMNYIFYNNPNLTTINLEGIDTSNVKGMGLFFGNCTSLQTVNLSYLNTTTVTDMTGMFSGCSNLISVDLSNLDTSNVTKLNNMFYNCRKIKSIDMSNFNTISVTNMSGMFQNCSELENINISNFDMSQVTNMSYMFAWSPYIQSIDMRNSEFPEEIDTTNMFLGQMNTISIIVKNTDVENFIRTCLNRANIEGKIIINE